MDQNDTLAHYGILGMKWGVRRYQNPDGTLTEAGKKRYDKAVDKLDKIDRKYQKKQAAADEKYEQAAKNLNGSYGIYRRDIKAFAKASRLQYEANKTAYKGKQWYNSMTKSFGMEYLKNVDPSVVSKGKEFLNRIQDSSAAMYTASLYRKMAH